MSIPEEPRGAPPLEDLVGDLQRRVGASGRVQNCYGGVRIEVLQPDAFPWSVVLHRLTDWGEEVRVRKQKGGVEIISSPAGP